MAEKEGFILAISNAYNSVVGSSQNGLSLAFNVIIFAILIVVTMTIIYYFYKMLSKQDILELNLHKYNTLEHPAKRKFLAILLYFVENIILMPLIVFLWFVGLSIFILIIAEKEDVVQILMLSAALVAAIRILAYHHKALAIELAKLFPLITLAEFIITRDSLNLSSTINSLKEIPNLFANIFSFIVVIFVVEFVLRLFYTIMQFWESEDEEIKVRKRQH